MRMKKASSISISLVLVVLGTQWTQAASVADIAVYKNKDRQSKIEEGAKKEGEIVWYTSLAVEDSSQVLQLFEKRYPFIKIKLTRLTSERVLQRYLTEFQANRFIADIIDTNDFQMEMPRRKGTLQTFYTPSVEKYDKRFLQPQGFWVASRLTMIVSGYNTRTVSRNEAPRKYEDLLDPKWKGKDVSGARADRMVHQPDGALGRRKGQSLFPKARRAKSQHPKRP
jgi:iron(III) transport system substrate-binding protein